MNMTNLPERFWNKVDKNADNGCWLWTAGLNPHGYGRFFLEGGQMAHRLSYIDACGEIPKPLVVDHLCRTRRCVNPEHMEIVDIRTNVMRGEGAPALHARKTHCKHGHALSGDNLRINNLGYRVCKRCQAKTQAAYTARKGNK